MLHEEYMAVGMLVIAFLAFITGILAFIAGELFGWQIFHRW